MKQISLIIVNEPHPGHRRGEAGLSQPGYFKIQIDSRHRLSLHILFHKCKDMMAS